MDDVTRVSSTALAILRDGQVMVSFASAGDGQQGARTTIVMPPEVAYRLARSLSLQLRHFVEDAIEPAPHG